jgi:hypothetical protein
MARHGADVRLEDHRLGGCSADDCHQPASRGLAPGGVARIPEILAPQERLHAVLGGLALRDRLRTRTGQGADGLVLDRRDRDRGPLAGTPQPGE